MFHRPQRSRQIAARGFAQLCVLARASAHLTLHPGWISVDDVADGVGKRLTFVRHAEGYHNKDAAELPNYYEDRLYETNAYWDPKLTPLGEEQSRSIAMKQAWRQQQGLPELVVVSPLTRAIQTATIGFANHSSPGGDIRAPPFIACSLARERIWIHTCDKRRERTELEAQ